MVLLGYILTVYQKSLLIHLYLHFDLTDVVRSKNVTTNTTKALDISYCAPYSMNTFLRTCS